MLKSLIVLRMSVCIVIPLDYLHTIKSSKPCVIAVKPYRNIKTLNTNAI